MAGTTGLEPATSAVTGQRSNQLSYVPTLSRDNLDLRHLNPAHARNLGLPQAFSSSASKNYCGAG